MLRIFQDELQDPDRFIVSLELVPGRQATGAKIDTLTGIAKDAFSDGRVSAVSITDNPGGNPSLSPDVIGNEIFKYGLDVIVHFACRDMNRVGMESRALQLARMGMKNILALTGDYSGKGYGGQGAPVFDMDSVLLIALLHDLSLRLHHSGDPDGFFTGCAVSPFKRSEAETMAQYRKLNRKLKAGASFIITQLGYDAGKFQELISYANNHSFKAHFLGSVYLLSPRSAKAMNSVKVPGAYVSDALYTSILKEWQVPREGLDMAVDRAAKLGVILKGLGYKGIHIGGIHRSFDTVGAILDKMARFENQWQDFLYEFREEQLTYFYLYSNSTFQGGKMSRFEKLAAIVFDHLPYNVLNMIHNFFFRKHMFFSPVYRHIAEIIEKLHLDRLFKWIFEDPPKKIILSCQSCGDCAIQNLAFQCPESGCPKHIRNGPCGGSRNEYCEVNTDRVCVWVRAYKRFDRAGHQKKFCSKKVPPRLWNLNNTSSWLNFHLNRDHQKDINKG